MSFFAAPARVCPSGKPRPIFRGSARPVIVPASNQPSAGPLLGRPRGRAGPARARVSAGGARAVSERRVDGPATGARPQRGGRLQPAPLPHPRAARRRLRPHARPRPRRCRAAGQRVGERDRAAAQHQPRAQPSRRNACRWSRGQRVVVGDLEFPANVYPWVRLASEGRARVDVVRGDVRGRPDPDAADGGAGPRRRGHLRPLRRAVRHRLAADLPAFGRFCRERGIWFVVDAIQALGCIPSMCARRDRRAGDGRPQVAVRPLRHRLRLRAPELVRRWSRAWWDGRR